jgi:hypothetical protein
MTTPHMQVGHLKNDAYGKFLDNKYSPATAAGQLPPTTFPDDYKMVAIVVGMDVETAYRLTNHIDSPWWENEGVTLIGNPEHRSTSVGDVVIMSDGRVLRCEPQGWSEICTENRT